MRWITKWGVGFTVVMVIVWPVLSVPAGVFTKAYFEWWVALSIIWGFVATVVIIVLPVWEARVGIMCVIRGLFFNDDLHCHMDEIDHKLELIMNQMNINMKPLGPGEGTSVQPGYRAKSLARTAADQTPKVESVGL